MKTCKDCGKKLGIFDKKIRYSDYYVCDKCYKQNRKKKEGKIASEMISDFVKAEHYAKEKKISLIEAYKQLKLGNYKEKDLNS